jgi:hypothetical protein
MQIKKALITGLRIVAVCLLFVFCMAVGLSLSGITRLAPQAPAGPVTILFPLLIFSLSVGIITSYLILRSGWHGWPLAGAMFLAAYGISTVVNQLESLFFLSSKLGPGMIRAIFVQGAIATALFAPLAVLVLGRWTAKLPPLVPPAPAPISAASAVWRIALLVIAFVFLYMFFGYYVAWQNPELRKYYGGSDWPSFFAAMKGNWHNSPWIFPLASFRALLFVGFMYPVIRMLRVARWESAAATALFLASWTTGLLLPNPLMPPSVARSHFCETLAFSLVFGPLLGWLMSAPPSTVTPTTPASA